MIIESIDIENFRCVKKQQLNFNDLTVIVGRNGSGKSSFLKAIDVFYDIKAPITIEDFFNHDKMQEILIRVTYTKLRDDEIEDFQTYIRNNKLIVTKKIKELEREILQKYYAASMQIKQFAEIREISGKRDKVARFNNLVSSKDFQDLSGSPKSADEVDKLMLEYEKTHTALCEPIEKEEQFFGAKSVGGGKLDNYTKFVFVPAVRELLDETTERKGSSLYQLLDLIVYRQVNAKKEIIKFKEEIDTKIKNLYSSDNLKELPLLGKSLTQTLCKFFPGAELKLNWGEVKPLELIPPKATPTLIEDGFEGDISRKGHGLQRALIITLLQNLALTVLPEEKTNQEINGGNKTPEDKKIIGPDLILAIEEPELYLHPLRCRYLSKLLSDIVVEKESIARNQIIYTTHSPFFIDLYKFNQIKLIKKQISNSECAISIITNYSLKQATEDLKKITNSTESNFTEDTFRAHTLPIMDTMANEGFFADAVVVVEGFGDMGILWAMQDILKKDWISLGIAVIPARGKNNIDRPVIIFKGFSIPTYFIFDGDICNKGKQTEKEIIDKNRRYLKLAGANEVDFPETTVKNTWACFKDNIESYIKESLTESSFEALLEETARELGYDKPSKVLKNIDGAEKFIKKVYSQGEKLPVLEDIITQISNLINNTEQNKETHGKTIKDTKPVNLEDKIINSLNND